MKDQEHKYKQKKLPSNVSNQTKLSTNNNKPYIHHQKPHTPNLNSINNQENNNNNKISLRSGHLIKKSTTKNPQDPQNLHQNQYYQNDHSHNQTNSNHNQTSFNQQSDSFGVTKSFNTNTESKNHSIILQDDKKYDSKQNSNQNSKEQWVKQQKQHIEGNSYNVGKNNMKYNKKQGSHHFEQQNNSKETIKKDSLPNNAHPCESNINLSKKNHINSYQSQTNSTTTYQKNHRTPSNSISTKNESLLINSDNNKIIYKNNFNTHGSEHHSTMTMSNQSYFTANSIQNRNNNLELQNTVTANTIKFHKELIPYYGGGNLEGDYIRVNSIHSNQNSNNTKYRNLNQPNKKQINQNPSSNFNTNLTLTKGVNFNINTNINNNGEAGTRNYKILSQLQTQGADMNNNRSFMGSSYDNNSSNMINSSKSIAAGQTQVVSSLPSFLTKKMGNINNSQQQTGLAGISVPQNNISTDNSLNQNYIKKQTYGQSYKQTQNIRQQRLQNLPPQSLNTNNTQNTPTIDYSINNYGYSNSFHQQQHPNNSKSSMTVRNLQYGKKLDTEIGYERTKSHNKNYSSHQFVEYQKNYNYNNRGGNVHGNNQHLTQNNKYQNVPTTYSCSHQEPHNSVSTNSSFHYNQSANSFTSSVNHNPNHSFNQSYQNNINNIYAMSYNPTTTTTHNEKTYILDSIAEKDQFNKIFVRNNQQHKPQDKGFLQANNASVKYLHRHNKQGSAKKINVISDQLNTSINPKSNQQQQDLNINFLNLKYIKTPINNKEQKNASTSLMMKSVPAENSKNYQKYLKVNYQQYEPVSMSKSNSKILKQCQRLNNDSKSMNSSFNAKDNKSQTHSVHSVSKKTGKQSINFTDSNDKNQPNIINYAEYNLEGHAQQQNNNQNKQKYYYQNPQKNNKREEVFRKTMDVGYKLPEFKNVHNQRKQNYSFGFDELREKNYMDDYENKDAENRHKKTYENQPFYRLNSPQPTLNRMDQNSHSNFYYGSPQNRQQNVITLFSPSEKSSKPTLKNHFLSQKDGQNQNNRQNAKHKKSIKKMLVSQSKYGHPKSQILYSLNFKDLKGEYQNSRPNSRTLLDALTKNQLARIFCSTFKIGQNQNGCDCIPKCFWVDQWIQKLSKLPQNISLRSLMKNANSNTLQTQFFNSQHNTLFKNNKSNQAISFKDFNTVLPNQDIQTFKQIQKDIPRTCSDHPTFKNDKYQDFLRQLLINFYYLDKKLGYVQGMNIIGAGIVYHSKTVHESLQLMDYVMNILKYRQLYQNDMRVCKQISAKTCKIIRHYCYDMYNYVTIQHQVDLQMFLMGWYFSMLGTFVPLQAMHLVINKFIQKQIIGIMEIIDVLMEKDDPNQIMQELSVQAMIEKSRKIDWVELIAASDKLKIALEKEDI